MDLLLAGGRADPNLTQLALAARRLGTRVCDARFNGDNLPALTWDPKTALASLGGEPLVVDAAFIRLNLFGHELAEAAQMQANAWWAAMSGWACVNPQVKRLNRAPTSAAYFKPAALHLAHWCGLEVATTCVGDCPCGAPAPAMVEARLCAPKVRVFVIGRTVMAFLIESPSPDAREPQDATITLLDECPVDSMALGQLAAALQLDWGAADFKTDPQNGTLCFQEFNPDPPFARFDQIAGGRLCDAMLEELGEAGLEGKLTRPTAGRETGEPAFA